MMLEIRYNIATKEITGWWSDRFGNEEVKLKNRPNELIVTLDITIPNKPLDAWLFNDVTKSLIPNPNYIEPSPNRDLAVEVDILTDKIKVLEEKTK